MKRIRAVSACVLCVVLSSCVSGMVPTNAMYQTDAATVRGVQSREFAAEQATTAQMYQEVQAANRPGDEKLTCEQLETEMVADINDPKVQAMNSQSSAQMQSAYAKQRTVMSTALPAMAASVAAGMLANMMPYGANTAMAGSQMAMQGMQAQAFTQQALAGEGPTVQWLQSISAAMGPMMRGRRVMELAKNKGCGFMQGIEVPPAPMMGPQ